jgi:hypothetical protein
MVARQVPLPFDRTGRTEMGWFAIARIDAAGGGQAALFVDCGGCGDFKPQQFWTVKCLATLALGWVISCYFELK